MQVVLAGASGLIGTPLAELLQRAGHEVTRLVRRAPTSPAEREWHPGQAQLSAEAKSALASADAVVNLCGAALARVPWTPKYKQLLRDSRIQPTQLLARYAAEYGTPVLVNASGMDIYGHTADQIVTESSQLGDTFLAQLCREWEAATEPAQKAGSRVIPLRSSAVIAAQGGILGALRPLFRTWLGARLGSGRQYLPWISLADEVAAIRYVLEHDDLDGPVNLAGPEPVTNAEFTRALARAMRRPAPWIVPAFLLRATLGTLAEDVLLTGQRAISAKLLEHGFVFQHPELASALEVAK